MELIDLVYKTLPLDLDLAVIRTFIADLLKHLRIRRASDPIGYTLVIVTHLTGADL